LTTETPKSSDVYPLDALKEDLKVAIAKGDIAEMIRLGNRIKAHPDAKVVLETMAKKEATAKAEEAKAKDALLAPIREAVVRALVKAGLTVQSHISRGTGHGIAPDGLQLGGQFIHDALKRPD